MAIRMDWYFYKLLNFHSTQHTRKMYVKQSEMGFLAGWAIWNVLTCRLSSLKCTYLQIEQSEMYLLADWAVWNVYSCRLNYLKCTYCTCRSSNLKCTFLRFSYLKIPLLHFNFLKSTSLQDDLFNMHLFAW